MRFSGSFDLPSGGLLPCLCIPSLPGLATVRICPLELREGHRGWSLFPTNKKWGTKKSFRAQEPHRVLLGFSISVYRGLLGHLLNTQFGLCCCPICEFTLFQGPFPSQIWHWSRTSQQGDFLPAGSAKKTKVCTRKTPDQWIIQKRIPKIICKIHECRKPTL